MSETKWLGPKDVADELGIPIRTVYQWNSKGIGPRAAKIGRHVRYRRADVETWIEAQYPQLQPHG